MQEAVKKNYKEFRFFATYETASWLEAAVSAPYFFDEIPWEFHNVSKCLGKFSKTSILQHYIYTALYFGKRREYWKDGDCIEEEYVEKIRQTFNDYGIAIQDDKCFDYSDDSVIPEHLSEYAIQRWGKCKSENDKFFRWFLFHEASFEILWEKITDEVFHILFANRGFLLAFNNSLSSYLKENPDKIPAIYRSNKSKVKRSNYIPSWTKKAVFFRDQGRCVLCLKDLSGLLSTDKEVHYDHIVPLALWGINDPCNIQLLCSECNLTKSGNKASTGIRYREWWV